MSTCKTCVHWHNKQRELNYWDTTGLCLCPAMKFNTNKGRLVGVIDRENERDRVRVSGNPAHDIEVLEQYHKIAPSRYSLATQEDFGCILHEPKKKKP